MDKIQHNKRVTGTRFVWAKIRHGNRASAQKPPAHIRTLKYALTKHTRTHTHAPHTTRVQRGQQRGLSLTRNPAAESRDKLCALWVARHLIRWSVCVLCVCYVCAVWPCECSENTYVRVCAATKSICVCANSVCVCVRGVGVEPPTLRPSPPPPPSF